MKKELILASESQIRIQILKNAKINFKSVPAKVDEVNIKKSCLIENINLEQISDILADYKAKKVSAKYPGTLVLGCDQTLIFKNKLLSKIRKKKEIFNRLKGMSGKTHTLFSSAVIYLDNISIWRITTKATLTMRKNSDAYLKEYIDQNYNQIVHSTGCYMIEGEGIRLFNQIEGDYFSILGIPLLPVLDFLYTRGEI
jgi:septum formation protein